VNTSMLRQIANEVIRADTIALIRWIGQAMNEIQEMRRYRLTHGFPRVSGRWAAGRRGIRAAPGHFGASRRALHYVGCSSASNKAGPDFGRFL